MTNPTPQTLPDMRKTFEATIARLWPGKDLSIGPDGCYTIWRTENDWLLWQAALAAQPPAVAAIPEVKVNYSFVTLWLEENCKRIAWTPEDALYAVSDGEAYGMVSAFAKQAAVAPRPPAGQQDRGEADCLAGIYKPAAKAAVDTLIALGYKFGHKPDFDGLAWNAPSPAAPGNGEGGK